MFPFYIPWKNTRKPKGFWCFEGIYNRNTRQKCVNTFIWCIRIHMSVYCVFILDHKFTGLSYCLSLVPRHCKCFFFKGMEAWVQVYLHATFKCVSEILRRPQRDFYRFFWCITKHCVKKAPIRKLGWFGLYVAFSQTRRILPLININISLWNIGHWFRIGQVL